MTIRREFVVGCDPTRAFSVWTASPHVWWPRTHTISGDADVRVVFEPDEGGRIYERTKDGTEHDWGEVTLWDPPHRFRCLWYLFFDRSEATELEISFTPTAAGTSVTLLHSGFDQLGESGVQREIRTHHTWDELVELYRAVV